MPDPQPYGSKGDGGEEVSGEPVVARGDAAKKFEFVEEAFDEIELEIELAEDRALLANVSRGRDVSTNAGGRDQVDDGNLKR